MHLLHCNFAALHKCRIVAAQLWSELKVTRLGHVPKTFPTVPVSQTGGMIHGLTQVPVPVGS